MGEEGAIYKSSLNFPKVIAGNMSMWKKNRKKDYSLT